MVLKTLCLAVYSSLQFLAYKIDFKMPNVEERNTLEDILRGFGGLRIGATSCTHASSDTATTRDVVADSVSASPGVNGELRLYS